MARRSAALAADLSVLRAERRVSSRVRPSDQVITYKDRATPVQLGDRVETRIWFRKHRGRVVYLPGVSPFNAAMESNGLRWVGVRLEEGGLMSLVVDPAEHCLRGHLMFVCHDGASVEELKADEDPHGGNSFAAPF